MDTTTDAVDPADSAGLQSQMPMRLIAARHRRTVKGRTERQVACHHPGHLLGATAIGTVTAIGSGIETERGTVTATENGHLDMVATTIGIDGSEKTSGNDSTAAAPIPGLAATSWSMETRHPARPQAIADVVGTARRRVWEVGV